MRNDHEKNYQKNLAASREISGDAATFFAEYQAQKLREWFAKNQYAPLSILDFGCADGLMTSFIQHIFVNATVYGVDPSQEHIALAQEMYEGIQFSVIDAKLPFADSSFDLIYATEVFHHIPHKEHKASCSELMRMLKPGGSLVIFELNPLNLATLYRFKTNPHEKDAQLMMPWYTRQLLKPYGLTKMRYYDFCLRMLEPYLTWFPFGGLYAVSLTKK